MPTKKAANGREYEIDGRRLTWHAEVWEDEGEEPFDVVIPMRFKLGTLRPVASAAANDATAMFAILEGIIPEQSKQLDEMDVNDFTVMFETWQAEYNALNGATLGEPERSSA